MKGKLIKQKEVSTDFEKRNFLNQTQIPKGQTRMEKITEVIARAWVVCDPNRGGTDPDALIEDDGERTKLTGEPQWKWFIPRAQETIKFLEENGYEVVRKE